MPYIIYVLLSCLPEHNVKNDINSRIITGSNKNYKYINNKLNKKNNSIPLILLYPTYYYLYLFKIHIYYIILHLFS